MQHATMAAPGATVSTSTRIMTVVLWKTNRSQSLSGMNTETSVVTATRIALSIHLDRLEAIVTEAEAQFGAVVG